MADKRDEVIMTDDTGVEIVGDELIIKLDPPVLFEGREYTEIDLRNLRNMKWRDMLEINKMMVRNGYQDTIKETSSPYALFTAARMAKLPLDFLEELPPHIAMEVYGRVLNFLNGSGLRKMA